LADREIGRKTAIISAFAGLTRYRPGGFSPSHDAGIGVYDEAESVIETHEQVGDFKVW
jgi:hypothetical protein